MGRPRDNQRSRLYDAERAVFQWGQTIPDLLLQAALNDMLDRRAIRARFGPRRVTVQKGRNGARAHGSYLITMGVTARNEWVMCHELAHCLTPGKHAAHGPEFAGVYLFLIDTIVGREQGSRLREAFRERRVKWNMDAVPKPATGPRVAPRQYEPLAAVAARVLPTPVSEEVAASRSAAAKKAWETRKQREESGTFPMRFRLHDRLAGEMGYQHEIDQCNAEEEGEPAPTWSVEGRVLVVPDMAGLVRAEYRADCASDWDKMRVSASNLRNRLRAARLAATPVQES